MTNLEKILKHIENESISVSEFERKAGLSNGYLNNTKKRGVDVTKKILDKMKQKLGEEYYDIFPAVDFVEQRRNHKINSVPEQEGISFIPISAQAGYPKRIIEPMFKSSLQKIFIPGMPYRGESYRIWEVEGNSMEPTLKEGFYVLTEKVDPPWDKIKEHYAYVIVTESDVFLKRLKKSKTQTNAWAAISDNDELYPAFLIPIEEVKELWLVKRKMDWEMSPPKRFDVNI